jgi:DNA helicase-2/ATP-dependent DNA helicase PcrA
MTNTSASNANALNTSASKDDTGRDDRQPHEPGRWADEIDDAFSDTAVAAAGSGRDRSAFLLDGLNERQAEAVVAPDPLLVIAGPGSGKTRVLTHRIARMVLQGTPAWRILAVTFTNKAAGEMRERLEQLLGADVAGEVWAGTFHSVCLRILRREHALAGLQPGFAIIDTNDATRVLKRILDAANPPTPGVPSENLTLASEAQREISWAKNHLSTLANDGPGSWGWLADEYHNRLAQMNAVDFDDLLLRTLRVLDDPEALARWSSRFTHICVDEFQDTNAPQLEIVRRLAGSAQVTAVGDGQQAIYGFRGARDGVMAEFPRIWPASTTVVLDRNYRSSAEILAVCQAVMDGGSSDAVVPQLWTTRSSGAKPVVRECDDDRDESAWVIERIRTHRRAGKPLSSCAVLVRTHAMTRPIEDALTSAGVPYHLVGGTRFYDRAEVRDAMAWLRLAANDFDAVSLERAVACPKRGVGEKTIGAVIAAMVANGSGATAELRAAAAAKGRGAAGLTAFADALAAVRTAGATSATAAVRAVLATGVRDTWAKGADADVRLENLDELVDAAASVAAATGDASLAAFVEHVALVSSADVSGDGVQVMTVHAAKGREFPVVIVPGLEEQLFPHARAATPGELDEERRLLFVACSRAEDDLWLSHARRRLLHGRAQDRSPSRFLADITDVVTHERAPLRADPYGARRHANRGGWSSPSRAASTPRTSSPSHSSASSRPAMRTSSPGPRNVGVEFAVGDEVAHDAFGPGVVTAVSARAVTVRFAASERQLDPSVAPMRKA